MAITPTPNMNLEKPAKGDTPWDVPVNNNWDDIDAHDHTPGKGVLVPTAGLRDLKVTSATYDSVGNKIDITVKAGRARTRGGIHEFPADTTTSVASPTVNTIYYVYVTDLGQVAAGASLPAGALLLGTVATGATVDNLSITDKRVILAADAVTDEEFNAHVNDTNNPHQVTAAQVGAVSQADLDAATHGTAYTTVSASEVIDEVVGAREGTQSFPSLDARLDNMDGRITASKVPDLLVSSAAYDSVNTRIEVTIDAGAANVQNNYYRFLSASTLYIPNPAVNTTYFVFLDSTGAFGYATGNLPAGVLYLADVATGSTVDAITLTDKRAFLSTDFYQGISKRSYGPVTSGSAAAGGGTVDVHITGASNFSLITRVKVTPSASTSFKVQFFRRDTMLAADREYEYDATGAFDDYGVPFPHEDLDVTKEIHIRITNNDAANASTFDIEIEEVA